MGRKKSLHPSDLLRKKERRKQLRKLQLQRQKARKNGLRKLAPEKLLQGIKKFNRMEKLDGKLDERAGIKRKNLVAAYHDVVAKRKNMSSTKKEGVVKIAGINKILGRQEEDREEEQRTEEKREENDEMDPRNKKEEGKENETPATPLEDLEFPPGLPRPIHLVPPPGIRPRPQRQLQPKPVSVPTKYKNIRKTAAVQKFSAPSVQILGQGNLPNSRGKRKRGNPEDLFDPFNPENPFFAQHPKRQNKLQEKVKKLERLEMQRLQQPPPPKQSPLPIGPSVPLAPGEYGPSAPSADMPSDLPALPEPGDSGGKLEVLLSDSMLSLRPTAVVVKRQEVSRAKNRSERSLELAPEVGLSKAKRKKKKTVKKGQSGGQTEYDQFLQEIESLGGVL